MRAIPQVERRIGECERLGFNRVIVPKYSLRNLHHDGGIEVVGVETVTQALGKLGLFDRRSRYNEEV